jgi:hypothetical protein
VIFTLGVILNITDVTQIFRLLLFTVKVMQEFWYKNWLGYILGVVFEKSSGYFGPYLEKLKQ